jgi:HK97 family phage major capsid protein
MSQLELEKTVQVIEKSIEDLAKGKATKDEVVKLIDERTANDKQALKAAENAATRAQEMAAELKAQNESFGKQLKALMQGGVPRHADGSYAGRLGSAQEAKTLGLMIMAATQKDAARRDHFIKSIEKMGQSPLFVDNEGKKTMTGVSQAGGGALVTVETVPSLIRLLESYGVFRAAAMNMPMGAGTTIQPKIDGLLTVYVPGEGGTMTNTDPTIGVVSLIPKALTALTGYSLELDEDSAIPLAEMLADLFARSFAYYEDLCGFLGDGTSTYFGFLGVAGALRGVNATIGNIKSLVVGSGNAYSELALVDFESVVGILPDFADNGEAGWYAHRYFYWTVMVKLALAAGGVTATEIITNAASRQKSYLGYPVKFTQVMPRAEANSQICTVFGNLRQGAQLGVRGGIEFAQSSDRYFDQGLIAVRGRNRVAINVHGVGDTSKAGPICGLITAGS